ncbi:hypothetical protein BDV10DRAFT_197862 [Aspergillus recurvatus]
MTTPPPNADFTIAWICPSRLELVAAREMFDRAYGKHPQTLHPSDANSYELGKIGRNNIAMVCLPSVFATEDPRQMKATFSSLRVGICVAVGSGIPSDLNDIRLGDVVVGMPERKFWGVVGLEHASASASTSRSGYSHLLTTAAHALTADRARGVPSKIPSFLSKMFEWYPENRVVYAYPGVSDDVLFRTDYSHASLRNHSKRSVVPRLVRTDCTRPDVHSGTIAAIDKPMTDVRVRDTWSENLGIKGIIPIPGAGGLGRMHMPMLVVCGVGDYADSHGDGRWRGYAAATAAAYAKELLRTLTALPVGETGSETF